MSRRLRIQYRDAIYHIMARGNGQQEIVHDDDRPRRQTYFQVCSCRLRTGVV
jgi:hypothetical protein